jgi:hypothetical protein
MMPQHLWFIPLPSQGPQHGHSSQTIHKFSIHEKVKMSMIIWKISRGFWKLNFLFDKELLQKIFIICIYLLYSFTNIINQSVFKSVYICGLYMQDVDLFLCTVSIKIFNKKNIYFEVIFVNRGYVNGPASLCSTSHSPYTPLSLPTIWGWGSCWSLPRLYAT